MVRIHPPGLLCERLPSGNVRWRVRAIGDKSRKTTVPPPDDPDFFAAYDAARHGRKYDKQKPVTHSLAWLVGEYEKAMAERVAAGLLDGGTLKQRSAFYARLCGRYGAKNMRMPAHKLVEFRDSILATPGAADNMVKAVRALYAWAIERGTVQANPAAGIGTVNRSRGAVAWSIDDLRKFREAHPKGTMPHLALSLFMFTACRIGDAATLGRANERTFDGVTWLCWQPAKKGSAPVEVPILPPLAQAIAAQKVIGPTYLLNGWGKSFASSAALGNWFRDRVREAGLTDRSPHGIRKAAGELMAIEGATQYHIMAVQGHTQAKTSEVYTRGVNRRKLASDAVAKLASMDW